MDENRKCFEVIVLLFKLTSHELSSIDGNTVARLTYRFEITVFKSLGLS